MATWQLQHAKTKLSELVELAQSEGVQTITKHGKPRAVILSMKEYESMREAGKPDLIDVLLHRGPKFDDFEIERDGDTGREIDLE